jgi:hypothetical protein
MTMNDEERKLYPQHAKLEDQKLERATVQRFLDWLDDENLRIAEPIKEGSGFDVYAYTGLLERTTRSKAALVAGFLGIDEDAFHEEKDAMIAALRAQYTQHDGK